jgi:hypothetical protein
MFNRTRRIGIGSLLQCVKRSSEAFANRPASAQPSCGWCPPSSQQPSPAGQTFQSSSLIGDFMLLPSRNAGAVLISASGGLLCHGSISPCRSIARGRASRSARPAPEARECLSEAKRRSLPLPEALLTARIYDLRHTFASIGAARGLSLPIIGKVLGHTQTRLR